MERLRPWPVAALIGWTLFTWGNRVPLLWGDSDQSLQTKLLGSLTILIFVVLALAALFTLLASAERLAPNALRLALGLAGWSIAYWLVRLPFILANDHPGAFKAVHSVLAAVAVTLSIFVIRFRRTRRSASEGVWGSAASLPQSSSRSGFASRTTKDSVT